MSYLSFVVLVVPALIGLGSALLWGPIRGTLVGAAIAIVAVFVLLMFQITIPLTGPGAEISRFSFTWGLFLFEWYRWLPSFLVGAALGSVIYRVRNRP